MQYINYRESWQRGTVDFPLEYHHITPSHPQYVMSLHWHIEFEIIRILSGSFHLSIDEREYDVCEGSSIFIPAGALHAGTPRDCTYECIVFDINMLMNKNDSCCKFINRIINHEAELKSVYPQSYNDIHQYVWSMFEAVSTRKEGYQLTVLGAFYQLIGAVFTEGHYNPAPVKSPRNHKRIVQLKTALEFMESSYNTPLTLEEMSASVNMSPKYFCRFFQEMTHRTPVDFLNYYMIVRACYQLMNTDQSITEVAYNSGFNDLSYFIKTFKKYKGTTPKKYLS